MQKYGGSFACPTAGFLLLGLLSLLLSRARGPRPLSSAGVMVCEGKEVLGAQTLEDLGGPSAHVPLTRSGTAGEHVTSVVS